MALVQIDWNPGLRVYRVFAVSLLVTAVVVAALAGGWLGRGAVAFPVAGLLALSGLVVLLGPSFVRRPIYLFFAGPAWIIGNLVTRVFLLAFFLVVITPIGLVARVVGHDPLRLRSRTPSYWEPVAPPRPGDDCERPF